MSRVKVKPVISPRIVQPDDPWWVWIVLVFALLMLGLVWQSFDIGRMRGGYDHSRAVHERNQLRNTIVRQRQEYSELSLDAAKYHRADQVNSEAIRKIKTDMMALRNERSELIREVGLLSGLISSQSGPVYIKDFQLMAVAGEREYRYSFIVAQALHDFGLTKGKLHITLVGEIDGKQEMLQKTRKKIEFVNYQKISGELILPADFSPKYLQLDIRPSSKKLTRFSQHFAWELKDAEATHGDQ